MLVTCRMTRWSSTMLAVWESRQRHITAIQRGPILSPLHFKEAIMPNINVCCEHTSAVGRLFNSAVRQGMKPRNPDTGTLYDDILHRYVLTTDYFVHELCDKDRGCRVCSLFLWRLKEDCQASQNAEFEAEWETIPYKLVFNKRAVRPPR